MAHGVYFCMLKLLRGTSRHAALAIEPHIIMIFSTLRCLRLKRHLPALLGSPVPELQDPHGLLKIHLWIKKVPKMTSQFLDSFSAEFEVVHSGDYEHYF
jgi:hypothetical protein